MRATRKHVHTPLLAALLLGLLAASPATALTIGPSAVSVNFPMFVGNVLVLSDTSTLDMTSSTLGAGQTRIFEAFRLTAASQNVLPPLVTHSVSATLTGLLPGLDTTITGSAFGNVSTQTLDVRWNPLTLDTSEGSLMVTLTPVQLRTPSTSVVSALVMLPAAPGAVGGGAAPVPEPGAALLFAAGALLVGWRTRSLSA